MNEVKKIKVLHIITRLDAGGSSTNTLETVARLDPAAYEVHLIAGRTHDPLDLVKLNIDQRNISCRFVDELVRNIDPWKDLCAFVRLRRFIRDGKYDIVHTHSSKAGILGRWAAHFAGVKKIVHTPHGHIFYGYFSKIVTLVFLGVERATARITTKLIALTPKGVEEHLALRVGRKEQWVAIPSGIDTDAFKLSMASRLAYRQLLGLGDQDIVLVCAARLEPIKNHRMLIDMLARLAQDHPTIKLVCLGDGADREALVRHAAQCDVASRVVFTGFRQDVASIYSACDIFVMASLNEGMGRSVLEAMAVGLPVAVSNVGGLPAIVTDGVEGLLVSPADLDGWIRAVGSLITDPALRLRLSRAAKKRVNEQYSIVRMVKEIEEVYAGL
ncbi:MAG: glycosyltransferase family 4 protein [Candidatus Omnitrophica bacterium]|nr:glycosyltransferase family 4 protein [Candidatus Omnitrophota bacterium]